MAVKLRLRRMGKKKQPIYKIVAADVRSPRDGRFIEAIGLYNPKSNPVIIEIQEDRALYWLGVGAQPTETVRNLFSKQGILLKNDLVKSGLSEEKIAAQIDERNKKVEAKEAAAKKKAEEKTKKTQKAKEQNKTEDAAEVKDAASEESNS